jgi:hypothetical protein
MRGAAAFALLSLIPVLQLYLTDFLNRIFTRENAISCAICGGENQQQRAFTMLLFTLTPRSEY